MTSEKCHFRTEKKSSGSPSVSQRIEMFDEEWMDGVTQGATETSTLGGMKRSLRCFSVRRRLDGENGG